MPLHKFLDQIERSWSGKQTTSMIFQPLATLGPNSPISSNRNRSHSRNRSRSRRGVERDEGEEGLRVEDEGRDDDLGDSKSLQRTPTRIEEEEIKEEKSCKSSEKLLSKQR